jgi:class 3 adenylate cyclase
MRISVRIVTLLFIGAVVLIVATVTLSVTLVTTQNQLTGLGMSLAGNIAATAVEQILQMLITPVELSMTSIRDTILRTEWPLSVLPNETFDFSLRSAAASGYGDVPAPKNANTTWWWFDAWAVLMRAKIIGANFSTIVTVRFEDGTLVATPTSAGCGDVPTEQVDWVNGSIRDQTWSAGGYRWLRADQATSVPYPYGVNNNTHLYCGAYTLGDMRDASYWSGVAFTKRQAFCGWYAPVLVYSITSGTADFFHSIVCGIQNSTRHFLGVVTSGTSMSTMAQYLVALEGVTPSTKTFILDGNGIVVTASDYGVSGSAVQVSEYVASDGPVPSNCASSIIAFPDLRPIRIGCRPTTATYPYAPLNALPRSFIRTTTTTAISVRVGSATYVAAAHPITSGLTGLDLTFVLILPQSDLLGDTTRTRNVAIAASCAVFVAALTIAFVLVDRAFRPLSNLVEQMERTAALMDLDPRVEPTLDGLPESTETYEGSVASEKPRSHQSAADKLSGHRGARGTLRPPAAPESAVTEISSLLESYAAMRNAVQNFARYVPVDVVQRLLERKEDSKLSMRPAVCAVVFSDIAGFTAMCERAPPRDVSRALRVFFARTARLTALHGGIVDKFIGDCVMCVWGAPVACRHPELRSALCGLAFHRATIAGPVASTFAAIGEPLRLRTGIACGEVMAGNMGSAERMSYTVIGEAVNSAARLEGVNREWGTNVLVSEEIAMEVHAVLVTRFITRLEPEGSAAHAAAAARSSASCSESWTADDDYRKSTGDVDVYEVVGCHTDALRNFFGSRAKGDGAREAAEVDGRSDDSFADGAMGDAGGASAAWSGADTIARAGAGTAILGTTTRDQHHTGVGVVAAAPSTGVGLMKPGNTGDVGDGRGASDGGADRRSGGSPRAAGPGRTRARRLHLRELIQHHATRHPARDGDVEFCHHFSRVARFVIGGRFEEAAAALARFDWDDAGAFATARPGRYYGTDGRRQQQPLPFVLGSVRSAYVSARASADGGPRTDQGPAAWCGLRSAFASTAGGFLDTPGAHADHVGGRGNDRVSLLSSLSRNGAVLPAQGAIGELRSVAVPHCDEHPCPAIDDDASSSFTPILNASTSQRNDDGAAGTMHQGAREGAKGTSPEPGDRGVVAVPADPRFDARASLEQLQLVVAHGLFGVF